MNKLPVISHPTLSVTLPVSKKRVSYRPFVIKEQKALLLAQESKDDSTILETLLSVIKSCSNNTVDASTVPTADLAFFFIQLRIASVGSEVKITTKCKHCNSENIINLNLHDIKVEDTNIITKIALTDSIGIIFRLPTMSDVLDYSKENTDRNGKFLYSIVESVYDSESVYSKSDYTEEEFSAWLDTFSETQVQKIESFVESIPELAHTIEFDCIKCKEKNSRRLVGLHSFFRFGSSS